MKIEIPETFTISQKEIQKIIKYYNTKKEKNMPELKKLERINNINGNMGGFYIPAFNEEIMAKLMYKAEYYKSIYNDQNKISSMKNSEIIDLFYSFEIINTNRHIRYIYWNIIDNKTCLSNFDKKSQLQDKEFEILKDYFNSLTTNPFNSFKLFLKVKTLSPFSSPLKN